MATFAVPIKPKHGSCEKAYLILKYAHDTAESMILAFDGVRKARNAKGTPTDEEQDLFRAMLIFASAGLDSMTKQLIRDSLPVLVEMPAARARIENMVPRHLRRECARVAVERSPDHDSRIAIG